MCYATAAGATCMRRVEADDDCECMMEAWEAEEYDPQRDLRWRHHIRNVYQSIGKSSEHRTPSDRGYFGCVLNQMYQRQDHPPTQCGYTLYPSDYGF